MVFMNFLGLCTKFYLCMDIFLEKRLNFHLICKGACD